ncbi:MAG: hypothetical protein QOD54_471 [Sphingomonadales bacterium]|nr:hypothetical protein [Sphingomonadales bacterium]
MMTAFLALLMQTVAQPSAPPGVPPIERSAQGVNFERTIAEFMDVCFRTSWNAEEVRKALKEWDATYVEAPGDQSYWFGWDSKHSALRLITIPRVSQCALSVASNQPRTGSQILAMLRPAVEAELGHSVQVYDTKFSLAWKEPDSNYVELITLALATNQPSKSIWYVFNKLPPDSPELKFLTTEPKPTSR